MLSIRKTYFWIHLYMLFIQVLSPAIFKPADELGVLFMLILIGLDMAVNRDFVRYKAYVSEEDVDAIRKLGIMLRIAESLDRSMSSCVVSLNCDVLGDSVIMKTQVEGDASLEIKDALNAYSDFKRIFHKNLEIL